MASPPAARSAPGPRRAPWAVRVSHGLLRTLYFGTAMLGLLVTPPVVVLVIVPALAAGAVVLLAGFIWYLEQRWLARRTLTATATATAALIPFGQAVQALRGVGTGLFLVVLGLVTVVATSWVERTFADAASSATPAPATEGERQSLRDLLQVVPLETVLTEWQALPDLSDDRLPPSGLTDVVETRTLLLDEMQRRNADGFAAWLASGATGPPDEYLRDHGMAA